jgi:hypothetical protein
MASPFPGMNPYLEQEDVWHDFHQKFIPALAAALVPQLRPAYIVKVDTHVYVHEPPAGERHFAGRPDVYLAEAAPSAEDASGTGATAGTLTRAPAYARVPVPADVVQESYIEIRDRESRRVVTVIELLSPSNKDRGNDFEQYAAKRRELLAGDVHLIEIDLLRGGTRMAFEDLPGCDYYVMVSRAAERPRVALWPLLLRDRLPKIPVPVRAPHPDALVDLQDLLNRTYDEAGYEDYVYQGAPHPPLHPSIAEWAKQFVPT